MIKFLGKIPKKIIVACSGGPDSMAVLDFLRSGKHDVEIAFFNHGTETSYRSLVIVENYAKKHKAKKIQLDVSVKNPAVNFYKHFNYKEYKLILQKEI